MNAEILGYVNLAGIVAVIAFLWSLHRDLANVRERLARLEGALGVSPQFADISMRRVVLDHERPATGE